TTDEQSRAEGSPPRSRLGGQRSIQQASTSDQHTYGQKQKAASAEAIPSGKVRMNHGGHQSTDQPDSPDSPLLAGRRLDRPETERTNSLFLFRISKHKASARLQQQPGPSSPSWIAHLASAWSSGASESVLCSSLFGVA